MKSERLLRAIGDIDDGLIECAQPKKEINRGGWVAVAACLCVFGAMALFFPNRNVPSVDTPAADTPAADSPGVSVYCYIENNKEMPYEAIDLYDRILYGLVPEGSMGTQDTLSYEITKADIGDFMGIVTDGADETLIGCSVYHFANYPDSDAICIIDTPSGYTFYVCKLAALPPELENTSSTLLRAYGLPEKLTVLEVWDYDGEVLGRIEDPDAIREIFQILAGKPDIGREEHAKRYVQIWKDAYGNDDIYYDADQQSWMARERTTPATDPYRGEPDYLDYSLLEQAHALFNSTARWIRIETETGMSRNFEFTPSICAFCWDMGYYALSQEETQRLSQLFVVD